VPPPLVQEGATIPSRSLIADQVFFSSKGVLAESASRDIFASESRVSSPLFDLENGLEVGRLSPSNMTKSRPVPP